MMTIPRHTVNTHLASVEEIKDIQSTIEKINQSISPRVKLSMLEFERLPKIQIAERTLERA
jgi:hypothetical protein